MKWKQKPGVNKGVSKRVIAASALAWVLLWPLLGQEEVFYLNHLTVEDGLTSQDYNYYLYQDNTGFVWISSVYGLNRFDGTKVRRYYHAESSETALLDDNIQSPFFEDCEGGIWFSTVTGLHRYNHPEDRFSRHPWPAGTSGVVNDRWLIYLDETLDWLLVKTLQQKLEIYPRANPSTPVFTFDLSISLRSLVWREDSLLHLAWPGTKYLFHATIGEEGHLTKDSISLPALDPGTSSLFKSRHGSIVAGVGSMLFDVDLASRKVVSLLSSPLPGNLSDLIEYKPGHWLLGIKNEGLYSYNQETKQLRKVVYRTPTEVAHFSWEVSHLHQDRSGNVWISTVGKGVFFTQPSKRKFNAPIQGPSLATEQRKVVWLAKDPQGQAWYATAQNLFAVDADGNWDKERSESVTPRQGYGGELRAFGFFPDGKLVVLTSKGILHQARRGEEFRKVDITTPGKPNFHFLHGLSEAEFLLADRTEGLFSLLQGPEGLEVSRPGRYTPREPVGLIQEPLAGHLFVSLPDKALLHYGKGWDVAPDTIPIASIHTGVLWDPKENTFWISSYKGLARWKGAGTVPIAESTFKGQPFAAMLLDEDGFLWLTGRDGLYRYNPKESESKVFRLNDGLQGLEFTIWAALQGPEQRLFLGDANGITVVHPEHTPDIKTQARPMITSMTVNDKPIPLQFDPAKGGPKLQPLPMQFSHEENNIEFQFAALEFSDPSHNLFKILLEPQDQDTIYQSYPEARYSNLQPGKYTFMLWASNSDGNFAEDHMEVRFEIFPAWYNTWWARILWFFLIFGLVLLIYGMRIRELKRETRHRLEVESFRNNILRKQMSPHFINNWLVAVQTKLMNQPEVQKFLDSVVKLTRDIFEYTGEEWITLKEEKELLEHYLEAENQILDPDNQIGLAFSITEIDLEETLVPPMLLQPFVENAIKHGIVPLRRAGKISITIAPLHDELIHILITDNGKGRAKSVVGDGSDRESALKVTQRRLQILSDQTRKQAYFKLIDLFDEQGQPCGTTAEIILPMQR